MILPDNICERICLKDQYFDLKGLSLYCSLSVPTLREHVRCGMPHFKVKGKILVKRSQFDEWIKQFAALRSEDLGKIVDGVLREVIGEGPY